MNILLLSAYDAQSHRYWRECLVSAFACFEWTVLTLPPRYFNWRIRGNSLSWAYQQREVLERGYDLCIATSMVDLSALRGLVPVLGDYPTILYCHENQFAYPVTEQQYKSVEPQMLNLYSALAADKVVFNSTYNRNTFLQGVDALLAKLPDQVPKGIKALLADKSTVLPVPLSDNNFNQVNSRDDNPKVLSIVWNHRWEYDKAPERLFSALKIVVGSGVKIALSVVGQQFRSIPPVFNEMKTYFDAEYPESIKCWGFLEQIESYHQLLNGTDVVISTALHDFQGLAVLEAAARGCRPVVPARLCYSEWFADEYLYESHIDSPELEAQALADHLIGLAQLKSSGQWSGAPDVAGLSISHLVGDYQQLFEKTVSEHGQC